MKKSRDGPGEGAWPEQDVSMLYNLSYCSRASEPIDAVALTRLIAPSQRYNLRHGITGILVFSEGIFLQWLEGPRESIVTLMDRITKDARHERIVMLSELEEVRGRMFPAWSMELVSIDDICQVLSRTLEMAEDAATVQTLRMLLRELTAGGLAELNLH